MSSDKRAANPRGRMEGMGWLLLGIVLVALLSVSAASALNYTSIVVAQETLYIAPTYSVSFSGIGPSGGLLANGSVAISANITVVNPSDRTLHFQQVYYCGWIEDLPGEQGVNTTRLLSDDRLSNVSGTRYFLHVLCAYGSLPPAGIPAHGNASRTLVFALDRTTDPVHFAGVQNITSYAAGVLGSIHAAPWNHWVQVVLQIDGVPPATSPTAGEYLLKVHLIAREEGLNLAA